MRESMRTAKLHDQIIQKYFPMFTGDENPQLPKKFEPIHHDHLIKYLDDSSAHKAIQKANAHKNKEEGNVHKEQQAKEKVEEEQNNNSLQEQIKQGLDQAMFNQYRKSKVQEHEKEKQLVARRLYELQRQRVIIQTNSVAHMHTQTLIRDLVRQIEQLNLKKQPYKLLLFKVDSQTAIEKILAINKSLKSSLTLLAEKILGIPDIWSEPINNWALKLSRFSRMSDYEGYSCRFLAELLVDGMKSVAAEEREHRLRHTF